MFAPLLDVRMSFRVAGARDCGPCQKWANVRVLSPFQKRWQAWDIWRGSAVSVAGAVQETCSSELLGGPGADFRRRVAFCAFWSFRSSGLLRWFCVTGAALSYDLASLFRGRRSSLDRWTGKIAKRIWYEAISSALNFPCLKDVSQNCFVFDVVNLKKKKEVSQNCFVFDSVESKNWGSLAELLRFWCWQV